MTHPSAASSWPDARTRAHAAGVAAGLAPVEVTLVEAAGRVLAADVVAPSDIPHYASSAMDGWAVAGRPPWRLISDGPRTGSATAAPLAPGEACRVATGQIVPAGATAVLRSERASESPTPNPLESRVASADEVTSSDERWVVPAADADDGEWADGKHIRRAGTEAGAGEVLVAAGARLNPAQLALAAACGLDAVSVLAHPTVALVLTGDEVVTSGTPGPGQVRDSFGPSLPPLLRLLGAAPVAELRLGDDYARTRAVFAAAPAAPAGESGTTRTVVADGPVGTHGQDDGVDTDALSAPAGTEVRDEGGHAGGVILGTPAGTDGENVSGQAGAAFGGAIDFGARDGGHRGDGGGLPWTSVIVTTGGTGGSAVDHVRQALVDAGAEFVVDRVAVRPGGPTSLARLPDGRLVLLLPGNPLAAMVGLLLVGAPAIAGLAGVPLAEPGRIRLAEERDARPTTRPSAFVTPYRLSDGRAVPTAWTGSAMLRGLAEADGLVILESSASLTPTTQHADGSTMPPSDASTKPAPDGGDEECPALPLPWLNAPPV